MKLIALTSAYYILVLLRTATHGVPFYSVHTQHHNEHIYQTTTTTTSLHTNSTPSLHPTRHHGPTSQHHDQQTTSGLSYWTHTQSFETLTPRRSHVTQEDRDSTSASLPRNRTKQFSKALQSSLRNLFSMHSAPETGHAAGAHVPAYMLELYRKIFSPAGAVSSPAADQRYESAERRKRHSYPVANTVRSFPVEGRPTVFIYVL